MLTVFLRAILLYILVIFALRLMGKRQLGELQPTELAITMLISNIASLPIEDPSIPMILGAIPILVLVGFELLVSNVSLRSRRFRRFMSGKPIVVISHGEILQQALHDVRFSIDDLLESLRAQSVFDLDHVQFAIIETNGQVSVLQKKTEQPYTAGQAGIQAQESNPPNVIISDGKLQLPILNRFGLTEKWLKNTLQKEKYDVKDVFLMTMDDSKQYRIIQKEKVS